MRTLLHDYLSGQGFRVETAADGEQALIKAREWKPDLVLLDVMMPGIDGFDTLRQLRRDLDTPVIFLTARVDEMDKVIGLELGADDYVTKPFSMHELAARIRAVLRRARAGSDVDPILRADGLMLDPERHRVELDRREVALTPTEFTLLETLMESPGRVLSRMHLLSVLKVGEDGSERTVDVHVRNIRAKIDPNAGSPRFIETVFGVGYRFVEPTD